MRHILLIGLLILAVTLPASACWVEERGPCRQCNATGYRACNNCSGGTRNCGFCFGSGQVNVRCGGCGGSGQVTDGACADCGGSGKVTETCDNCSGTGTIVCITCEGAGQVECFFCGGTGETVVRKYWDPDCGVDHRKRS